MGNKLAMLSNFHDTVSGPLTYLMHFSKQKPEIDILVLKEDTCTSNNLLDKLGIKYKLVSQDDVLDYTKVILCNYIGRRDIKYFEKGEKTPHVKFLEKQNSHVDIIVHDDHWKAYNEQFKKYLFDPLYGKIDKITYWRTSIKKSWESLWADYLIGARHRVKTPKYNFYNDNDDLVIKGKIPKSVSIIGRADNTKPWLLADNISFISGIDKFLFNFSLQTFPEFIDEEKKRVYSNKTSVKYNYLPNQINELLNCSEILYNVTTNSWNDNISKDDPLEWTTYEAIDSLNMLIVNKFQHDILYKLGIESYYINNPKDIEEVKRVITTAVNEYSHEVVLNNKLKMRNYLSLVKQKEMI